MSKPIIQDSIRLLALPLSQKNPSLIYFYAQRIKNKNDDGSHKLDDNSTPSSSSSSKQNKTTVLINKVIGFGSKQWFKLSEAPVGSWKSKVYTLGERMMDRIPYEEWALKTIDPAIVPSTLDLLKPHSKNSNQNQDEDRRTITLLYPKSLEPEKELLKLLSDSMREREPHHKKWMKLNVLLSPLTIPFAIIPIIPNLPFFYMMWRAWSHWRAFKASQYLNRAIKNHHLKLTQSSILDKIYSNSKKPFSTTSSTSTLSNRSKSENNKVNDRSKETDETTQRKDGEDDDQVILTKSMVKEIKEKFELPGESESEIIRAINQVQKRFSTGPKK